MMGTKLRVIHSPYVLFIMIAPINIVVAWLGCASPGVVFAGSTWLHTPSVVPHASWSLAWCASTASSTESSWPGLPLLHHHDGSLNEDLVTYLLLLFHSAHPIAAGGRMTEVADGYGTILFSLSSRSIPRRRLTYSCVGQNLLSDLDSSLTITFGVVKYVPDWFSGAGFKRLAKYWRATVNQMADVPYEMVKKQMVLHIRSL